jgi:hypothetical protein
MVSAEVGAVLSRAAQATAAAEKPAAPPRRPASRAVGSCKPVRPGGRNAVEDTVWEEF